MAKPEISVGTTFPIPIPAGTSHGCHYLHFTTTFFNISYYTKKPKQDALLVNEGEFKVYCAVIGPIVLIKVHTPLERLYFAPDVTVLSEDEFTYWTTMRRAGVTRLTFYLLSMKNRVVANCDTTIIGQWHIYEAAKHQRAIFKTSQQVEEEADRIFKTHSHRDLESKFLLIG